jgi:glycosyltransferase involved in cell wall biosynthesis
MSDHKTVLHIISNLASGGVQHLLIKSLAVFDRSRYNHMVCCVSAGGVYEQELRNLGIPYWIMKRRARFDPTILRQMAAIMRTQGVDIVHTLNFTANAWGRVAAKMAGVSRIIAHERGTGWTENILMRWVDRRLYSFTDVMLANSYASKTILMDRIGIPGDRIRVLHNGLPDVALDPSPGIPLRSLLGVPQNACLIGTIGRLDTPKGHVFLLDALPEIWREMPDTHFVIIGGGPLDKYLRDRARKKGLFDGDRLHFSGFIPEAARFFRELDLIIHPSIRESLGNVLIEAGWAKKVVVATDVDGCGEIIEHGKTGLLLPGTIPVEAIRVPGVSPLPSWVVDGRTHQLRPPLGPSPHALSEAVVNLLRHPERRAEMGAAARERVQRMFSISHYVKRLEEIYSG